MEPLEEEEIAALKNDEDPKYGEEESEESEEEREGRFEFTVRQLEEIKTKATMIEHSKF